MAKIGRVSCRRAELAVEPPLSNALVHWSSRTTLLLRLHDARSDGAAGPSGDGWGGGGEASPLPNYSSDTLAACERALLALPVAELNELDALSSPREVLAGAQRLLPADVPAARFALETALLDRLGLRLQRPLWSLLRECVAEQHAGNHDVDPSGTQGPLPLCALLSCQDPGLAGDQARRHVAAGVRCFKLKIGPGVLQPAQERVLRCLRAELGAAVQLRLDANGSLDRATLGDTLQRLASYAPEFVEEPILRPLPEELSHSPCPWALDESLQTLEPARLDELVSLSTCRALVLKPTTLGGFSRCLGLARLGRRHDCEPVISHALEGPLGWLACVHLAMALRPGAAAGLWPLPHQAPAARLSHGAELDTPHTAGLGAWA
jgi:L-alanine-DL-glutamate epimerase-like enolase superfamily enzyme